MPTLSYSDVDGETRTVELDASGVTIGRGVECTVRSGDPRLSRLHARFVLDANGVWIEDLGSSNGVYLGNQRVQRERVPVGEVVVVGSLLFYLLDEQGLAPPTNAASTLAQLLLIERQHRVGIEQERNAFAQRVGEIHHDMSGRVDPELVRARDEAIARSVGLERALAAVQDEVADLRAASGGRPAASSEATRLLELERQVTELADRNAALEVELDMRRAELSQRKKAPTADDQVARLSRDLDEARSKASQGEAAHQELAKMRDEFAQARGDADRKLAELHDQLARAVAAVDASAAAAVVAEGGRLEAAEKRAQKAEKDLQAAQIRAQAAERNVSHATTSAAAAERKVAGLEQSLREAQGALEEVRGLVRERERQLEALDTALRAAAPPTAEAVSLDVIDRLREAEKREGQLVLAAADAARELAELRGQLATAEATAHAASMRADALPSGPSDAERTALATAQAEAATLRAEIATAHADLAQLRAELAQAADATGTSTPAAPAAAIEDEATAGVRTLDVSAGPSMGGGALKTVVMAPYVDLADELAIRVGDLETQRTEADRRASSAEAVAKTMAKDLSEAMRRASDLDGRVRNLTRQLAEANERGTRAEQAVTGSGLTEARARAEALEAETEALRGTVRELEDQVGRAQAEVREWAEAAQAAIDEAKAATRGRAGLQEAGDAARAELADVHAQLVDQLERADIADRRATDAEIEVATLGARLEELEAERGVLSQERESLAARLASAETARTTAERQRLDAIELASQRERDVLQATQAAAAAQALGAAQADAEDARANAEIEAQRLHADATALRHQLAALTADAQAQATQLATAQAEADRGRVALAAAQARLAELEPQLAAARAEAAATDQRLRALEHRAADAQQADDALVQQQLEDARADRDDARRDLAEANLRLDHLAGKVDAADLAIGRAAALQRQLDEALSRLAWADRTGGGDGRTRDLAMQEAATGADAVEELGALRQRLEAAEAKAKAAQKSTLEAIERASRAEADLTSLMAGRATNAVLEADRELVRQELTTAKATIDELRAQASTLKASVDGLRVELVTKDQLLTQAAQRAEVVNASRVDKQQYEQLVMELAAAMDRLGVITTDRERLANALRTGRLDGDLLSLRTMKLNSVDDGEGPAPAPEISRTEALRFETQKLETKFFDDPAVTTPGAAGLGRALTDARAELTAAEQERDDARAALARAEAERDAAETARAAAAAAQGDVSRQLEALRERVAVAENAVHELRGALTTAEAARDDAQAALRAQAAKAEATRDEAVTTRAGTEADPQASPDAEAMRAHLTTLEDSLDSLRANMRAAHDETSGMPPSDSVTVVASAVEAASDELGRAKTALRALLELVDD